MLCLSFVSISNADYPTWWTNAVGDTNTPGTVLFEQWWKNEAENAADMAQDVAYFVYDMALYSQAAANAEMQAVPAEMQNDPDWLSANIKMAVADTYMTAGDYLYGQGVLDLMAGLFDENLGNTQWSEAQSDIQWYLIYGQTHILGHTSSAISYWNSASNWYDSAYYKFDDPNTTDSDARDKYSKAMELYEEAKDLYIGLQMEMP